eukprot:CAMPEP_0172500782 /NCGR_PEP_ID=MMETSP1066-20121228/142989_1 /TAXON_ID=671091 /ORGANISM="Coscinodiscus wailesii, Strain CCMP2513" /LENGTH=338 /DNA_ID=CAMNT_0013275215 /DNA_START=233 /DNA_END=1249 /DNA_ORIENTATION=+
MLVCGDGDLSYSASQSAYLSERNIELTATVLENQKTHTSVYKNSKRNVDIIKSYGHEVRFGIDATRLQHHFPNDTVFNHVRFNFPHWPGKNNNCHNRKLLSSFLQSVVTSIDTSSNVQIALLSHQGGSKAKTFREWRQSWLVAQYAAEAGLLLTDVSPYLPDYNLSSYRGQDRPFHTCDKASLYEFMKIRNGNCLKESGEVVAVSRDIQLCCCHELHVILPQFDFTWDVEGIVRRVVPEGIRVEVPLRDRFITEEGIVEAYFVVYCGERLPLTRVDVESYREDLGVEVEKIVRLRRGRRGGAVSRPFPYSVMERLLEKHLKNWKYLKRHRCVEGIQTK